MGFVQLPAQRAALGEERRDWWQSAACRETDPELFFPIAACGPGAGETARAKAVCAACRVRRECLQYALATHQVHGIWGGTSEDERRLDARGEGERGQCARREIPRQAHGGRDASRPRESGAGARSVLP
jgi:WhiB family redox-sensing transcriptional regulator